jgi:endoglucanase
MPSDPAGDKIIVSIHMYAPYNFALSNGGGATAEWDESNPGDTIPITDPIDYAYEKFIKNGIPVIIGEFGAMDRGNDEARSNWAEFYTSYAKSKGIPCFWWDNAISGVPTEEAWGWTETFGILDRETNRFVSPEVVDALMKGTE